MGTVPCKTQVQFPGISPPAKLFFGKREAYKSYRSRKAWKVQESLGDLQK
jgi:hypothetical protein